MIAVYSAKSFDLATIHGESFQAHKLSNELSGIVVIC